MNSVVERNLLAALTELENAVRTMATTNPKPDLQKLFSRIDGLTRQLPKQTDPQLFHYLHKKSYEKARLYLQGRNDENAQGNCDSSHSSHR
jgi:hypothetical protein